MPLVQKRIGVYPSIKVRQTLTFSISNCATIAALATPWNGFKQYHSAAVIISYNAMYNPVLVCYEAIVIYSENYED